LQFTTALAAATDCGQVKETESLARAAVRLAFDQLPNGSWPLEGENNPGSPTAYGSFLATYLARESLKSADPVRFREPINRSRRWLESHETNSLMDVSVALLVATDDSSPRALEFAERSYAQLRKGQSDDGGWGPFPTSSAENFDTALALIALAEFKKPAARDLVTRGRGFLIAHQQPDGSWTETTRPPGAESYAQRVSTSAWAALALIATRDGLPGKRFDLKR
jgi:hypothetical protein